jgi:hypothetical protein
MHAFFHTYLICGTVGSEMPNNVLRVLSTIYLIKIINIINTGDGIHSKPTMSLRFIWDEEQAKGNR